MNKTLIIILLVVISFELTSCSSLTNALETGAGAGLGAATAGGIGYVASKKNLQTTAISALGGAVGGGLLTSLFQSRANKKKIEEQQKGYDLGKSDAIKSLYWVSRGLQKPGIEADEARDRFLQVTQGAWEESGEEAGASIDTVPYAVTLPVQEP